PHSLSNPTAPNAPPATPADATLLLSSPSSDTLVFGDLGASPRAPSPNPNAPPPGQATDFDKSRRRSATVPVTTGGRPSGSSVGAAPTSVAVPSRSYAKKRVPSWTDRILWRCVNPDTLSLHSYYRCDGINTSDHLPVCSHFTLKVPL